MTLDAEFILGPLGGFQAACISAVTAAKTSVYLFAFQLTDPQLISALIAAKDRGVAVAIILDPRSTGPTSNWKRFLHNAGVDLAYDHEHRAMHAKTIVIDSATVIIGSANFTTPASTSNVEHSLLITSTDAATVLLANWTLHRSHSVAAFPAAPSSPSYDPHTGQKIPVAPWMPV